MSIQKEKHKFRKINLTPMMPTPEQGNMGVLVLGNSIIEKSVIRVNYRTRKPIIARRERACMH